jgi:hypothetical protein
MFLEDYAEADSKAEKGKIVSKVLDIIREASPEGAFVTYENGSWYEVSERIAREKIGALFRDFLPKSYRSSAKSKKARKSAEQKQQAAHISKTRESIALRNEGREQSTQPSFTGVDRYSFHRQTAFDIDDEDFLNQRGACPGPGAFV